MTRAIGVTEYGGPEALHEVDVPREDVGPGQVRVRVRAATVNPTDTGVRSGGRAEGDRPTAVADVPGMEVAGVLEEIGPDTQTDLAVGDRVMGIVLPSGPHGAYREDVVLPVRSVTRVPDGASDAEAATLPMNGLTARAALDHLDLRPGQVVAVTGAAGALGGYIVQLAKADGLTVVADAAPKDEELVRSLGADVLVRRGEGFAEEVRERYREGVDGLADAALLGAAALPAVRDGGAMVTFRGYRGTGERGLRVTPVRVFDYGEELEKLQRLRDQAEQGAITLRVADTYPAREASAAHTRFEAGGVRGRLVLLFD